MFKMCEITSDFIPTFIQLKKYMNKLFFNIRNCYIILFSLGTYYSVLLCQQNFSLM